MPALETILGLLVAVVILVTISRLIGVAYPILLILGGLVLGFVPGLPAVSLQPDLVLLFFLPPLLYWESLNAPLRDLRANLRSIALLAVGLVLATMAVVAMVAHQLIPGLSWATAFVLGAIVAPTDEVAATAIAQRLGIPARLATVLQGESLLNDATSLVAYTVAVAAVVHGTFSLPMATARFLLDATGGVAVGLTAAWCISQIRRHLFDPPVENTISLLSGFAAYIPAQALGLSGVLAVVALGLYLGRVGPRYVRSETRLQAQELWSMVVFLLNCLIFILVGLQLHPILVALQRFSTLTLLCYAALVSVTVILVRMLWILASTYLPRLSRRLRARDPLPPWQQTVIVAWTGMRGGVSLAEALAIPVTISAGAAFPQRDLILFLTFAVILATLVLQGLSLPLLIRGLGVQSDGLAEREEAKAHLVAARAALGILDGLATKEGAPHDLIVHLRQHYADRDRLYTARYKGAENAMDEKYARLYRKIQHKLLNAERSAVIDLRDHGVINDETLLRVQRNLDLEELLLDR